ncbi:MAG: UDP-glucose 4-epimerase GalE [Alphaproteobacteria bacterium]|nr:UDP-glucose 4-epimerase GalE [Alphaproteobacteria bacterium]
MAVLITGGAGYIGSHMVHDLVQRGEIPVVLDDLSTGFEWLLPASVTLIRGDIADQALVRKIIEDYNIDTIAHFAAKIVVPDSVTDPLGYYESNTVKARSLIESTVKNGVKQFIFSSTAAVYGEPDEMPVSEDTRPNPVSPYGRSKLMVEWMLEDARHAHGLQSMILRYFNVAGADPEARSGQATPRATHLIKTACEVVTGKRPSMSVFGSDYKTRDGTCIRDYIHVTDLAAAHSLALDYLRNGNPGIMLNCAYGHGSSVNEVIDAVKRVSGVDFAVHYAPRRAGDPPEVIATGSKIKSVLGFKPRYDDLDMIVKHALAFEEKLQSRS